MQEIWVYIEGYNNFYQVSNLGRVRSVDRIVTHKRGPRRRKGQIIAPVMHNKGYPMAGLTFKGKKKNIKIHRLVAQSFIPNPRNKPQVNHIDGNKLNNIVTNLEWVDNKENMAHATSLGLKRKNRGLESKNMKLCLEDIIKIRELYQSTLGLPYKERWSYKKLALRYRVDATTIMNIVRKRKYYKDI